MSSHYFIPYTLEFSFCQLEGQKGVTQVFTDLNPDSCHIDDFKVWDIEVHDDTAIALVIGHADVQQSKHLSWVEVSILCCLTGNNATNVLLVGLIIV